jgi:hypothetical protein
MGRRAATFLVALALAACGSTTVSDAGTDAGCPIPPTRNAAPGEGQQCTLQDGGQSNCPSGLDCVPWSAYSQGFGICRLTCNQSCPSGESCKPNVGSSTSQSCQCTAAEAPCEAGDSCAASGLECHPDFDVCLAPTTDTTCPSGLVYSKLWQLCVTD